MEQGASTDHGEDETGAEFDRPSRAVVRSAQGVLFAVGAPLGWLLLRLARGATVTGELAGDPLLYGYLLVGTATAFGVFGYLLGRNEDELTRLARRYRNLSIRDELTGLYNSRYFWESIDVELHRAVREGTTTSLLLMDLDHFKRVNDRWGHRFGDAVLQVTGEYIADNCRRSDIAARVGGEEFAVILPNTGESRAARVGERIREGLELHRFEPEQGETLRVTLSVGVASLPPQPEPDAETLYEAADAALYRAKERGRNLLESSSEIRIEQSSP